MRCPIATICDSVQSVEEVKPREGSEDMDWSRCQSMVLTPLLPWLCLYFVIPLPKQRWLIWRGALTCCQANKVSSLEFFKLQLTEEKHSLVGGKSTKVWGLMVLMAPANGRRDSREDEAVQEERKKPS